MKLDAKYLVIWFCIAAIQANSRAIQQNLPAPSPVLLPKTLPASKSDTSDIDALRSTTGRRRSILSVRSARSSPSQIIKRGLGPSLSQEPKIRRRSPSPLPVSGKEDQSLFPGVTRSRWRKHRNNRNDNSKHLMDSPGTSRESSDQSDRTDSLHSVPHHEDSPSYFEKSLERSSVGAISHGPNGESKQAQPLKKLFKNVKTKYSGGKPTKATTREIDRPSSQSQQSKPPGILINKERGGGPTRTHAEKIEMNSPEKLEKYREEAVWGWRRRKMTSIHENLTRDEWEKAKKEYFAKEKENLAKEKEMTNREKTKASLQRSADKLRSKTSTVKDNRPLDAIKEGSRSSERTSGSWRRENDSVKRRKENDSFNSFKSAIESPSGSMRDSLRREKEGASLNHHAPHASALAAWNKQEGKKVNSLEHVASRWDHHKPESELQKLKPAHPVSPPRPRWSPAEREFLRSEMRGVQFTRNIFPTRKEKTLSSPAWSLPLLYHKSPSAPVPKDFVPKTWLAKDMPRATAAQRKVYEEQKDQGLATATKWLTGTGRTMRDDIWKFKQDKKGGIRETNSIPDSMRFKSLEPPVSPLPLSALSRKNVLFTQGSDRPPAAVGQSSSRRVRFSSDYTTIPRPADENRHHSNEYQKLQASPPGGTQDDEKFGSAGRGTPFLLSQDMARNTRDSPPSDESPPQSVARTVGGQSAH